MGSAIEEIIESIKRLDASLEKLNDKESAPVLGHWRTLEPQSIQMAYDMIEQGSSLVEHTSTKFTLMSKISIEETVKIAEDLVKGCESLTMATLVFHDDETGCSWSLRKHTKRHVRSVLVSSIQLMESVSADRLSQGAVKTGAVWSATQSLSKLPKGNRNSVRRDLFSYMADCNDTMQEFQEILDASTSTANGSSSAEETYHPAQLPIAQRCVALVKCSRGTLNAALKACDCVGSEIESGMNDGRAENLDFIRKVLDSAKRVGEGMTDMASLLYPPLEIKQETAPGDHLWTQVKQQHQSLKSLLLLFESNETCMKSEEISNLVSNLQGAVDRRYDEVEHSFRDALI